jgi:hypothetical protein
MPFDGIRVSKQARILIDALELLRRDGWCQNRGKNHRGHRCILGAIYDIDRPFHQQLLVPSHAGADTIISIIEFNDAPKRTFAEIEAWFEERIAAAL